jgi:tRNA A58 N-methylase Trm61
MGHVCPWYIGYFLINPFRKWGQNPAGILAPYVKAGDTVFEPGPGMGFFTLELARKVGPKGRVFVSDIQSQMLQKLWQRARKAGVEEQIDMRQARENSFGVDDIVGKVDFVLAFAVGHEMPSINRFFEETSGLLKKGGHMLFAEPRGHISDKTFAEEIDAAQRYGLRIIEYPSIQFSRTALMKKD